MIMAGDLDVRSPFVGESLNGYISEITAMNELVKVAHLSSLGGVTFANRPTLSTTCWDEFPALAEVLEIDVAELQLRSNRLIKGDPTRRAFFGTTIHRADLRTSTRFFAPSALALSEHHRALWQHRLPFDIDTGEILLDRCHRCDAIQRWRHSVGVRYCDVCVEDLAAAPTLRLPESILEDVRLPIGLINPNPKARAKSVAALPDRFRGVEPGLVFELILRATPVAHSEVRWSKGSRCWANEPVKLAEGIGLAWNLLEEWPSKIWTRISDHLAANDIRFGDGNGGATLKFLRLRKSVYSHDFIAKVIDELHDAMNLNGPNGGELRTTTMGVKNASCLVGLAERPLSVIRRGGGLKTVSVLRDTIIVPHFRRKEIEQVAVNIRRRKTLSSAKLQVGIPVYGLEQIVATKDLGALDHPYFARRYSGIQTTDEHVQDLIQRLVAGSSPLGRTMMPLVEALRAVPGGLKPWGIVINAMLGGEIPYHIALPVRAPLTAAIRVSKARLLRAAESGRPLESRPFGVSAHISKRDAGEALNLGPSEYTELFSDLPTTSKPTVEPARVEEIAKQFIAPLELAVRTGMSMQQIIAMANSVGLKRSSPAGYLRELAEAHLIARER